MENHRHTYFEYVLLSSWWQDVDSQYGEIAGLKNVDIISFDEIRWDDTND